MFIDIGSVFKFGGTSIKDIKAFNSVGGLVSLIVPNIFMIAGLVLFIYALVGGFTIISGSGDAKKMEEGQKTLTSAIMGFVIIFVSYWVIQLIELLTGGANTITNSGF